MEIPEVVIPYLPLGKFHIPRHVVLACLSFSGSRKIRHALKKGTAYVGCNWNMKFSNHVALLVSVNFPSQVQEFKMAFCVCCECVSGVVMPNQITLV